MERITVGRIGSTSEDGVTIVYNKNDERMLEVKAPILEEGLKLDVDDDGYGHIVYSKNMAKEKAHRLLEQERFYNATKDILFYRDYLYIARKFPTNCYTMFLKNPYFLVDITRENSDTPVCTFPAVDSINVLSTFEDRLRQMEYAIRYCLERNEEEGNTWIPFSELEKAVKSRLSRDGHPLLTGGVLPYLRYHSSLFYVEESEYGTIEQDSKVALLSTYLRERTIYRAVVAAASALTPFPRFNPVDSEDFSTEQNNAVKGLILKGGRISVLDGGPGTGKTTTLRKMLSDLLAEYPDAVVYFLAPTGRAAKRIAEVFEGQDIQFSTVHKFLGYGKPMTRADRERIRSADLIIVDESSMIDLALADKLLGSVNFAKTKVIFVGDRDQLPSIGAGNFLADLINIGVHTEHLTENYRSQGSIVSNARKINRGNIFLQTDETFRIRETPEFLCDYMAGMDPNVDVIITPYRVEKRSGSTERTNKIAQKRIFGSATPYGRFRLGDRIIITKTNYKQGYFNGETGVIISCMPNGDYLVSFGDRDIFVKDPDEMALGYAITIHKSQGSEYPVLGIAISKYSDFITRKMLYTAVTRAKQKEIIWVDAYETLEKIILNNPEENRRTFLSSFCAKNQKLS